jgi:hypothetical protein
MEQEASSNAAVYRPKFFIFATGQLVHNPKVGRAQKFRDDLHTFGTKMTIDATRQPGLFIPAGLF